MSKPLALTEEALQRIWLKAVQLRPQHRDDMEALIAMARERNALVKASGTAPQLSGTLTMLSGHPWGSP